MMVVTRTESRILTHDSELDSAPRAICITGHSYYLRGKLLIGSVNFRNIDNHGVPFSLDTPRIADQRGYGWDRQVFLPLPRITR